MKEHMKISLGTLFPELEYGFTLGYSVDQYGYIWSTRQGKDRKLKLQGVLGGNSYTAVNKPAGRRYGRAITATYAIKRHDILKRLSALNHTPQTPSVPAMLIASGYIIGYVTPSGLSFSTNPKLHKSISDVRTETERLAKMSPGKTFVYLKIEGNCTAGGVVWS